MSDPDVTEEQNEDIDEEEILQIEDELFELEDELIDMQGTTIRSHEQEEEEEDIPVYAYKKPEVVEEEEAEEDAEEEGFEEQLAEFSQSMEDMGEAKPGQLLAADLRDNDSPQFEAGRYVLETDGGRRLFAGRGGQVVWFGDTVNVLPIRHVEGDVDADVGDIRYDGNVFVEGMVHDGRYIEARGNIWIMGGVGRSDLKASGDVVVQGGIKGNEDQRIEVHGNLYARFVENARMKVGGNVIINEVAMHSYIEAGKGLHLIDDDGNIIGGEANVAELISAQNIGSSTYPETIIRMGAQGVLQEELEQLEKKRANLEKKVDNLSKDVKNLEKKKEEKGLSPKDEERYRNLKFELNHAREDLQQTKVRLKNIEEELDSDVKREILAAGKVFPGVELHMGSVREPVEEERSHCSIYVQDAEIKFDSYHEPGEELDLGAELAPDLQEGEEKYDMPPLDEIRPHIIYEEEEPMFNREERLKFFLGLEEKDEVALLDITEETAPAEEEAEGEKEEEGEGGEKFQPHRWWAIAVREGESKKKVRRYFSDKSDDSVKVRCETPKEGLRRAANYFDESPENLAVKILEEGSKGILGFGKKDYLIRVVKKEVLEQEKEEEEEENVETFDLLAEAEEEEDVAGFINLENSADGLKLTVYPPQGHGLPVTMEQVKNELEESGYDQDVNWPKVEEMVEEQAGEADKIAPRQRDPEIDGSFSVTMNEQETAAYLTVVPPKPEGVAVTEEEVVDYLESEGTNFTREKVEEVFAEELFDEEIIVAEGKEPEHGRDAALDFKVDIEPSEVDEEEEGEEDVDYRKGEEIVSVQEGDVLVEKVPATEGEPGIDVYGNEIPPEVGEDLEISAGDNVRISDDNTQYIADEDGRARFRDGEVWVEPVFIINGDLDYEVGNVRFDGVVMVEGMILDGFKVEASQRVEAESVGKAVVECEGDVVLEKGMVGRDEGILKAGGDIFAKYIENSRVQANGSVVVEEAIMHSEVDAGEYVIVKGQRRGDIVGGITRAGKAIAAEDIGSAMASKTELAVGIEPKIRDRIKEIEELIEEQKLRLTKIKNGLQGIKEQANKLGGIEELPEEKQDKRVQLVSRAKAVRKKMENLGEELQELRQKIQESDGGEVYCRGDLSDGVKLTVQTATLHLTDSHQHVRYGMVDGEITKQSYKELDVEIPRPEE